MAIFSAVGMLLAVAAAGVLRAVAPGAVDIEGTAQHVYVTLVLGVVGSIVGASTGAGVTWVRDHASGSHVSGHRASPGRASSV
jgi:hypothetical protein